MEAALPGGSEGSCTLAASSSLGVGRSTEAGALSLGVFKSGAIGVDGLWGYGGSGLLGSWRSGVVK